MARKARVVKKTFDEAFGAIDKMEQAVCYRTVRRDFTVDDVCDYLWPAHAVRALREAYPYISASLSGQYNDYAATINDVHCWLTLDTTSVRMSTPCTGLIAPQDLLIEPHRVMEALREVRDNHLRFNKLRAVVTWLNEHARPMAARYYFPSLGALLPLGHEFHVHDGLKSAGCNGNISDIASDIREASVTVATGLLCEPDKVHNEGKGLFKVRILSNNTNSLAQSNEFVLL